MVDAKCACNLSLCLFEPNTINSVLFICDDIDFKGLPQPCFKIFECISVHLSMSKDQDIIYHTMYRPPNFSKTNFQDFSPFVESAALSCCENIIFGDTQIINPQPISMAIYYMSYV